MNKKLLQFYKNGKLLIKEQKNNLTKKITLITNKNKFDIDKAICWIRDECQKIPLDEEYE